MRRARPASRLADLDAEAINRLIPHRYPFLMIDRVVEIFADTSAVGIKNVTVNEPFFPGHFPGHPIMPGVLIVEAMAQTAAALVAASVGADAEGKLVYFMTIEQARFRRPVVPGDQLRIKVIKQQKKLGVWKFVGHASVEGKTAAEAVISAKIMDPPLMSRLRVSDDAGSGCARWLARSPRAARRRADPSVIAGAVRAMPAVKGAGPFTPVPGATTHSIGGRALERRSDQPSIVRVRHHASEIRGDGARARRPAGRSGVRCRAGSSCWPAEPWGDAIGARLIQALREQAPGDLELDGVGGPRMARCGLRSPFPMRRAGAGRHR